MQPLHQMPRKTRRRRPIYAILTLIAGLFIFYRIFESSIRDIWSSWEPSGPVPRFNAFIDQKGNYLPFIHYKILQLAAADETYDLTAMREFLEAQTELQQYFKLLPQYLYYIPLAHLKNQTKLHADQIAILVKEQNILDQDETSVNCRVKPELYIDKQEIRLPVEITDPEYIKDLQDYRVRWNQSFGDLIVEQFSQFYITIAHQYKTIPSKSVENQLKETLKKWETYGFEIILDPIELFSLKDVVTLSALVPDIDMDSYELFYSNV